MPEKLIYVLLSASFLFVLNGVRYNWVDELFTKIYNGTEPRIVIIGGGVSGIAAATRLVKHGFKNVKIVEAENRIGGRINTVAFGENYIDLGAHWIHGEEGNPVFEIASNLQLTVHSGDFKNIIFLTDNGEKIQAGMDIYVKLFEILESDELKYTNESLHDYIVSRGTQVIRDKLQDEKLTNAFIHWSKKMACTGEGCDNVKDVSAKGTTHFESNGDMLNTWKRGGYYSIINILLEDSPIDLNKDLFLNNEVTEIKWHGTEAIVKCTNGSFIADHVIVTVSLAVLKERHSTMFVPSLPEFKLKAIEGLGIGTVDKIYISFPYQWWPDDVSGFSFINLNLEEESWENGIVGFYAESTARKVLVGWLIGESAKKMEILSKEQIIEGCNKILNKYLSKTYQIPQISDIIWSKWSSNPHFRGSYSYRSMKTEDLNTGAFDLAKSITNEYNKEILMFAGEATHSHFYSTVHGAMESGWREADNIAKLY